MTRASCAFLLLASLAACASEEPADRIAARMPDGAAAVPAGPSNPVPAAERDTTQSPPLTPDGWGALRIATPRGLRPAPLHSSATPT